MSRYIGDKGEEIAKNHLKNKGYTIRKTNFTCRQGEIDIICTSPENHLVFVEVKTYHSSNNYLHPLEAITKTKQKKIRHTALHYLTKYNIQDTQCQFDALILYENKIDHIQNIF